MLAISVSPDRSTQPPKFHHANGIFHGLSEHFSPAFRDDRFQVARYFASGGKRRYPFQQTVAGDGHSVRSVQKRNLVLIVPRPLPDRKQIRAEIARPEFVPKTHLSDRERWRLPQDEVLPGRLHDDDRRSEGYYRNEAAGKHRRTQSTERSNHFPFLVIPSLGCQGGAVVARRTRFQLS